MGRGKGIWLKGENCLLAASGDVKSLLIVVRLPCSIYLPCKYEATSCRGQLLNGQMDEGEHLLHKVIWCEVLARQSYKVTFG